MVVKPVRVRLFLLQVFVSFFDFSFIHSFMFIRHITHHYNKGGIIKKVKGSRSRGDLKETTELINNQVSSGLKISLIWQYGPEKVEQASTKIRVTKAESNIKLIPIEKKFFKLDSTQPIAISLDLLTN